MANKKSSAYPNDKSTNQEFLFSYYHNRESNRFSEIFEKMSITYKDEKVR